MATRNQQNLLTYTINLSSAVTDAEHSSRDLLQWATLLQRQWCRLFVQKTEAERHGKLYRMVSGGSE